MAAKSKPMLASQQYSFSHDLRVWFYFLKHGITKFERFNSMRMLLAFTKNVNN